MYPVVTGKAYRFEKIAEGIYYATSAGTMVTGSNNILVVGDRDALVVDTGTSPAAARAMVEDIKLVTDKPVRTVVNTHFHYDHTDGNQVYAAGKADVIAHEYVKFAIEKLDVLYRQPYNTSQLTNVPNRIGTLKKQIAEEKDLVRKTNLEQQLAGAERGWEELKKYDRRLRTRPTRSGWISRWVRRRAAAVPGPRAHDGDTFVLLPKERIICTGDMLETAPSYMGDGQFDEWVASLGELQKLEFDTILPGHGRPMKGKAIIPVYQSYLTDLINQVANLRKQGSTAEQTAERVDLTSHKADYPNIQRPAPICEAYRACISGWTRGRKNERSGRWQRHGGFARCDARCELGRTRAGYAEAQGCREDAASAGCDLERYKATIKGLTQFGDRLQGTERNRRAIDWIEAQLKSYGCPTERMKYVYNPPPPPGRTRGGAAARSRRIRHCQRRNASRPGGSRCAASRGRPASNTDPDAQPDATLRALNAQPTTPGPREAGLLHQGRHRRVPTRCTSSARTWTARLGRGGQRRRLRHGAGDGAGARVQRAGRADRAHRSASRSGTTKRRA